MKQKIIIILLFLFPSQLFAQIKLNIPVNIQPAYDKQTRTLDGRPGKNYWQNTADYDLKINFDPITRMITGTETIDYVNNSPDSLKQVWFKLYPNIYKKGGVRDRSVDTADLTDGVVITAFSLNGTSYTEQKLRINGTNMIISIPAIAHGQHAQFAVSWNYILNKHSDIRTGEIDPGADFVAYFFPRIAVYDDIDGWNRYPYTGSLEFYNDFCHFKTAITVPNTEVVWATGNLLNAKDVLSQPVYQRLLEAEKNDAIITVIDSTEFNTATNHSAADNTWLYEANDVTDFVFACSDHYMWHSTSLMVDKTTGRRTRVDVAFNPKHKDYYTVINDARKTVEAMSFDFPKWPYPYPHETVFDGLDQMEYPMMVNDNPLKDHAESVELTDHEIFHTMFPFYMGTNETKYAWMDEGWATIGEWIISPIIDSTLVDEYGIASTSYNSGTETDLPIITLSTEIRGAYFTNSYPKPAMGYLFAKDMLGDDLFYKGLHYYIRQWHGKHPIPWDFFNCMNTGSSKNLNWFWKKWFFDNGIADLSITKVNTTGKPFVIITNKGGKPLPVDLKIEFADGSFSSVHKSIEVWQKDNNTVTVMLPTGKKIKRIILGGVHTPDRDRKDNVWDMK